MTEYIQNLYKTFKIGNSELPQSMIECCEKDSNIINKPFHLKGTQDTCVVLVHGWTSTPYEMRVLGEQLNSKGFAVDAPLLSGHGSKPEHLVNVKWEQWVEDVEKTYKRVRKQYKKVYVGGMSVGGNLSIQVAANNKDIDGLILMSTPYKMRHEITGLCAAKTMNKFTKYKKKYYPKFKNKKPSITQLISYQKYPISSAFEALEIIRNSHSNLEKITQPVFIIQPEKDHLISKNSIYNIYDKIGSDQKEMRIIQKASHNFMGNGDHADVFESVVDFVKKN